MANSSIAPNLEGLDFIETEEDVKAVESAALKIQSTFRGKKFRSKLGAKSSATPISTSTSGADAGEEKQEQQLESRMREMQVNDNRGGGDAGQAPKMESASANTAAHAGEDEAERAATKIQAGFKGYRTRKELEGKLAEGGKAAVAPPHGGPEK